MNAPALKRFQFSLKTPLIAIAVLSLAFAWFRFCRNDAIRRNEAVSFLRTRGVQVIASDGSQSPELFQSFWGDPFKTSQLIHAEEAKLSERESELLELFPNIEVVEIRNTQQGDADKILRHIAHPHNISILSFSCSDISTTSFGELKRFEHLKTLAFLKCNMSSADFSEIPFFSKLEHLRFGYSQGIDDGDIIALDEKIGENLRLVDLNHTDVSDDSLALICKHNNLLSIQIENTSINGSGLAALSELSSLNDLDLSDTKVQSENLSCLLRLRSSVLKLDLWGTSIRPEDITPIQERWGRGSIRLDCQASSSDANSSTEKSNLNHAPRLPGPPGPK